MKKISLFILFVIFSYTSFSQVWLDIFAIGSTPTNDFFASGNTNINFEGTDISISNKELFTTFANTGYGGGINLHYVKSNVIVGLEACYVAYQEPTEYMQMQMFRLGPTLEYYFFLSTSFRPYLGIEGGLQQAKAIFNKEVVDKYKLTNTYFGIGPRAGFVYLYNEKFALRFGAKYIYLERYPYLDINAGVSINLGDF